MADTHDAKASEINKFNRLVAFEINSISGMRKQDMTEPKPKATTAGRQGGLNAEIQSRIGHQLRAMYDDVVRQGVPDRFANLIKQLDAGTPPASGDKTEGRD